MLVVPMRYDERVIGVITLSKLGLNQFDEDNLRLLSILADQAATAVESARLLTRSQRLALELRGLLDMSSALSESLDPREVADLIARHLASAMGVERCGISYWERSSDRLLTWGYWPASRARGRSSRTSTSTTTPTRDASSSARSPRSSTPTTRRPTGPRWLSWSSPATGCWRCCRWSPRAPRSASSS
jgi:hypothetical protein